MSKIFRGMIKGNRIIKNFKPDVIFYTGGYIALPLALVSRKIPSLLYVPDIEPGLALKFLARFTDCIAVTVRETFRYLPANARVEVTGYPVRTEILGWEKRSARNKFTMHSDLPVLLVYGGSKGARTINTALSQNLSHLLEYCQILHICGELDWPEIKMIQTKLTQPQMAIYHPFPYLHEDMGAALASADLVISRAGASILGELPIYGLPAILVPYPHAWDYQKVNAAYLEKSNAALVLEDQNLKNDLFKVVVDLLENPSQMDAMGKNMAALANPGAAEKIAGLLVEISSVQSQNNGDRK
jgi:UDP-N-acetylglucosamine--N-acetylmuramyl-(pentapeptide) pyrophosphoryl-undecaprenol N-acetylglucosamine transferase